MFAMQDVELRVYELKDVQIPLVELQDDELHAGRRLNSIESIPRSFISLNQFAPSVRPWNMAEYDDFTDQQLFRQLKFRFGNFNLGPFNFWPNLPVRLLLGQFYWFRGSEYIALWTATVLPFAIDTIDSIAIWRMVDTIYWIDWTVLWLALWLTAARRHFSFSVWNLSIDALNCNQLIEILNLRILSGCSESFVSFSCSIPRSSERTLKGLSEFFGYNLRIFVLRNHSSEIFSN